MLEVCIISFMHRRLFYLFTILLLSLSSIANAVAVSPYCTQNCSDDDDQGHCPPTCQDCTCCSHLPSAKLPTLAVLPPLPVKIETTRQHGSKEFFIKSVDSEKIPHVPKT